MSRGRHYEPLIVRDGLAVYRIGHGKPVFLMPGPHRFERVGTRHGDALIGGLRDLGRQVVTFDPPGSGRSVRAVRLSMDEVNQCSGECLDAWRLSGPVDALGHSMGGLALLGYALERPGRVGRLVLVATGTGWHAARFAAGALWNRGHPDFPGLAALGILQTVWPRLGAERLVNNYIERRSVWDPRYAEVAPVTAGDWLRPTEGRTDWYRSVRRLDYGSRLPEIGAPTLVLCGRHDAVFPPVCSERLHAGIRGSRLVTFEHSGHYPYLEQADRFWSEVREFLSPAR